MKQTLILLVISQIAEIVQSATTNLVLSSWIKANGTKKTYSGTSWYTDITSISYSSTHALLKEKVYRVIVLGHGELIQIHPVVKISLMFFH
jgi:hypothetical protein